MTATFKEANTREPHVWQEPWRSAPLVARPTAGWTALRDIRPIRFRRRSGLFPGGGQRHQRSRSEDQRRDSPYRPVVLVPDGACDLDRVDQQISIGRSRPAARRSWLHLRNRSTDEERILLARQPGSADTVTLQSDLVSRDRSLEGVDFRRPEPRVIRLGQLHALRARA